MFIYSYSDIKDAVQGLAHGGTVNVKSLRPLINRSVREILSEIDLRSAKRHTQLAPFLAENQYTYTKPSDMKGLGIIDIKPQIGRDQGFRGEFTLTTPENFDRFKRSYRNVAAVSDHDSIGKLLVSAVVDSNRLTVHDFDSLTANGTVAVVSPATNVTLDNNLFFHGTASINFDVDTTGTDPIVTVRGMTAFDLSDYESQSLFLYVWIPSGSQGSVSSITLQWQDDSDNYYQRVVTATNEGLSFQKSLNLLRFDWDGSVTTVGSPDKTALTGLDIKITLSAVLTNEVTDWRVDYLVARKGVPHDVIYYSKYGWTDSSGTYKENSTVDTDLVVADTDEFDLIMARIDYNIARSNRAKIAERTEALNIYEKSKENYQVKYPSEAKGLTTSYYEMGSLGDNMEIDSVFDRGSA